MTRLTCCSACSGFLPRPAATCPHCGARPARSRLARRLILAAGAGAVSVTLMACYGAPPHYYNNLPPQPACETQPDPDAEDPPGDGIDQNCDGVDGDAPEEPNTSVRAAPGQERP